MTNKSSFDNISRKMFGKSYLKLNDKQANAVIKEISRKQMLKTKSGFPGL